MLAAEATVRTGARRSPSARGLGDEMRTSLRNHNPQTALLIGAALVVLGAMFLTRAGRP